MFQGASMVKARSGGMIRIVGRFIGKGAVDGVCPTVTTSGKGRGMSLSRSGAGNYIVTMAAGSKGVDFQGFDAQVVSATKFATQPVSYSVANGTVTFNISTPSTAAAADPANTDEIWVEVIMNDTVQP